MRLRSSFARRELEKSDDNPPSPLGSGVGVFPSFFDLLPLPLGEGWGEGLAPQRMLNCSDTVLSERFFARGAL
jgi:hypothetical protein